MNIWDVAILAAIALAVLLGIVGRKKRGGACSCGCESCGACEACKEKRAK